MKKNIKIVIILVLIILTMTIGINLYIINVTNSQIIKIEEINFNKDIDCIVILGAGVRGERPSPMLEDRLLTGIDLYNKGI